MKMKDNIYLNIFSESTKNILEWNNYVSKKDPKPTVLNQLHLSYS